MKYSRQREGIDKHDADDRVKRPDQEKLQNVDRGEDFNPQQYAKSPQAEMRKGKLGNFEPQEAPQVSGPGENFQLQEHKFVGSLVFLRTKRC